MALLRGALANYIRSTYSGFRLQGLFRRVDPRNGLQDRPYPVVRQQNAKFVGTPVLYDYAAASQSSGTGRRPGRIRHLHRPSRPQRELGTLKLQTLNCAFHGIIWVTVTSFYV